MSSVRRIRLGDTRYRLKPLTREQKLLLNKAHYVASEWLFCIGVGLILKSS